MSNRLERGSLTEDTDDNKFESHPASHTEGFENKAFSDVDLGDPNGHQSCHSYGEGDKSFPSITASDLPSKKVSSSPSIDTTEDLRCGLGSCKPDCLQVFNNPKAVLVWLCWLSFLQGFMVNGVNNVNTTTLERRFQLSSSAAGSISSSYDISAAILAIPVSYFGAHAHQPRMLAFAAFMMTCGAFVMTIPHFGTGLYDLRDSQADECVIGYNATSLCNTEQSNISKWLGVLLLGMIMNGVGGCILYSIGIVFLDSCVSSKTSPLFQGFLYSSATLGPAVGYLLGGYFVESLYVDFDKLDSSELNIEPGDPRFVGAWWVGFMATGVLMFTAVLLLVCYPRELPAAKTARLKRVVEVHDNGSNDIACQEGFGTTAKDLPTSLKLLLTNPVFMVINLAGVCESLIVSGIATFMPKFIQNQFTLTAGFAAIVGGACAVPGAAGGQFTGGLVSKLAKLKIKGMLRMNIVFAVLAAICSCVLLCRCSIPKFAGINVDYTNSSFALSSVELQSDCNDICGCTTLSYEPICGIDGIQYFTPCHAGCQSALINGTKMYVNCTCITPPEPDQHYVAMAEEGTCDTDCELYYVFLPFFFLVIFLVFMVAVPSLTVTLRCVAESQRSFAVGLQWVFIRLLGSIPGPILMGYVFDTTCVVWQEKCDAQGSCWIYDNKLLSTRLFIMTAVIKAVSAILFFVAYKIYKPPPDSKMVSAANGSMHIAQAFDNLQPDGSLSTASIPHYVQNQNEPTVDVRSNNTKL